MPQCSIFIKREEWYFKKGEVLAAKAGLLCNFGAQKVRKIKNTGDTCVFLLFKKQF
jgi:hypothetical protein